MTLYSPYPISEELQAAGVVFREEFTNADLSAANGLVTVGSPTVSDGLRLNGTTQYGYFNAPKFHASVGFSIIFEFIPTFSYDDNLSHYLFDSDPHLDLGITKHLNNTLHIYISGVPIFIGNVSSIWKTNQKNVVVISATSGDTTIKLNGVKIADSVATAFGSYAISQLNIGANNVGSWKFQGVIRKFVYMNVAIDDLDMVQWESGGLDLDFSGDKSLLTLPMRQAYTNPDSEYITPVKGRTVRQSCLMGSDGKTPGEYPDILYPRGLGFDGSSFGTVLDSPDLTFSDENGDKRYTIGFDYTPGDSSAFAGIIGKYELATNGEYLIYQSGGTLRFLQSDLNSGGYFIVQVSLGLVSGKRETWLCVSDGSGAVSGLKVYRNNILAPTTPTIVGAYTQMRNGLLSFKIGVTGLNYLPLGSKIRALQVWDKRFSLQQAKVWSHLARKGMIR